MPIPLFTDYYAEKAFFNRRDLVRYLAGVSLPDSYLDARAITHQVLNREVWEEHINLFENLPPTSVKGFSVKDGAISTLSNDKNHSDLTHELVNSLSPWRKGPWEISGVYVDAEWRSDIKYSYLSPVTSLFKNASILDIGSGNGYYAFRALDDGAGSVLCLDPSEKFFFQFELFQKFVKDERVQLEILGYEYAPMLRTEFDVVLCMGVVYHQKNPLHLIECCRDALLPGGRLILDSMTYPSDESVAFFPEGRYAKARNVYFLPSTQALISMCKRVGFRDIEIISEREVSIEEQRQTKLAPFESLSDFLDPKDSSLTVEGYPAPGRLILVASR